MKLIAALISVGLASGAAAQDAPRWVGIWAADPAWCVNAAHIGSRTPAPIEITLSEVNGYENSCEIIEIDEDEALSATRMMLRCQSEGETYEEPSLLMMEGRDVMWRWYGAGEPLRFERCAP